MFRSMWKKMAVVIIGLMLVVGVAAYAYIPSTPQYALYSLEQSVGSADNANFMKYYQLPQPAGTSESDNTKLQDFKKTYYQPLNPINAYRYTKIVKETINDPGDIIYLEQPGQPKLAFRMMSPSGTWVVVAAARL